MLGQAVDKLNKPSPEETESIKLHLYTLQAVKKLLEDGFIIESLLVAPLRKFNKDIN